MGYHTEDEVQAACSSDDDCKGYWERTSGEYFILKSGSRTFEKGVPNLTVLSVKVKTVYVEGRISNAEYHFVDSVGSETYDTYHTEDEVQAACSSDDDCKGYWERTSGEYFILKSGSRTFEK